MATPKKIVTVNDWVGLGGKKYLEQIAQLFRLVYVAGPMRGITDFNFPAFDEARDFLNTNYQSELDGKPIGVVSPADMDRAKGFVEDDPDHQDVSLEFYQNCMRRDVEIVSKAFAILLMKGWRKSTGANTELFVARACGVKVWVADYDVLGEKMVGFHEAPPWLRSPLIYGDDGDPFENSILSGAFSHPTEIVHFQTEEDLEAYQKALERWRVEHNKARRLAPGTYGRTSSSDSFEVGFGPLDLANTALIEKEIDQTLDLPPSNPDSLPVTLGQTLSFDEQTILEEANHLIFGPRNADYGSPLDDFTRTGTMWGAILDNHVPGHPVEPEKVGLMMVALKISRECNKHKRDSLVDIAGYAGTVDMVVTERERRASSL